MHRAVAKDEFSSSLAAALVLSLYPEQMFAREYPV